MDYIIGSGAILESGPNGSITPASLHAGVEPGLASCVKAAAVDFEGTSAQNLSRLLVVAAGANAARFRQTVTEPLRRQQTCTLADVLRTLAHGAAAGEVHLFAHWLPDTQTCEALAHDGIQVVAHPLESIEAASVVAGQRHRRWQAA